MTAGIKYLYWKQIVGRLCNTSLDRFATGYNPETYTIAKLILFTLCEKDDINLKEVETELNLPLNSLKVSKAMARIRYCGTLPAGFINWIYNLYNKEL